MQLTHVARRSGRLSSFLREEMEMSAGLMNRLKWQDKLFVNGVPRHTDYPVAPGGRDYRAIGGAGAFLPGSGGEPHHPL